MKKLIAVSYLSILAAGGCTKTPPPLPDAPAAPQPITLEIGVVQQATSLSGSAVADSTIFSEGEVNDGNYGGNDFFCVGHQNEPACGVGGLPLGNRRAVIKFALP